LFNNVSAFNYSKLFLLICFVEWFRSTVPSQRVANETWMWPQCSQVPCVEWISNDLSISRAQRVWVRCPVDNFTSWL